MIKLILFDVDGCLVDSAEANWKFINSTIDKYNGIQITFEEYKEKFYSRTLKEVIEKCCPVLSERELAEACEYGASIALDFHSYVKPTKGAKELLEKLKGNFKLGVVSSRLNFQILDDLGISHLFQFLIGYNDSNKHKPDPEPILVAMKKFGTNPEETIYIGDQINDVRSAQGAGVKSIILGNDAKGDFNITDFLEVLGILERM